VVSCTEKPKEKHLTEAVSFQTMTYSKMFGIAEYDSFRQLFYLKGKDTTWSIKIKKIKQPIRVAVLSSVYAGFIETLEEQSHIVAVDNHTYYNDSLILAMYSEGIIKEIGEEGQIQIGELLALEPDFLIGSTLLLKDQSLLDRLKKQNIELIICDNFREQHPLARAEWIKCFGFLFNSGEKANTLFKSIEQSYLSSASELKNRTNKPKILTDALYMDVWNVPGGKSYTAQLIEDAGGDYIFKDRDKMFYYPLNLESVIKAAEHADYWIHVNQIRTKKELLEADKRYGYLRPFQLGNVFNNNKRENQHGGNDFWEMGVVRPDWVLKDLIQIFSGNKISSDKLFFYTQVD
jgi:iron complex transport system substrate-binding protein